MEFCRIVVMLTHSEIHSVLNSDNQLLNVTIDTKLGDL